MSRPLRLVFSAPAYWPAHGFGGPVPVLRELVSRLAERGHTIDVYTTSLVELSARPSARTRSAFLDGATVHYLATPLRFRWMGVTPTLPLHLGRQPRPDAVHIFGFRDPVGTATAAWCRARRVPYLFEALGMFEPKLRKVKLKRAVDATIVRHVADGAARLVAASEVERREYLAAGASEDRIAIRPNGFPRVVERAPTGGLRRRLGLGRETPLVLSVGRMARGKGLDLLVGAMPRLDGAHLAVVGPDDGHGVVPELRSQSESLGVAERVHLVGALDSADLPGVYADADVFALASRHENFGMVAAEAASVGTPVLVTDRCGVSELLGEAAIVVPYDAGAVGDGLARLLGDADLRVRLGVLAREVARTWSWDAVTLLEESLLRSIVHP